MTVEKMIEILKQYDPEIEVVLSDGMLMDKEVIKERYFTLRDGLLVIGPA